MPIRNMRRIYRAISEICPRCGLRMANPTQHPEEADDSHLGRTRGQAQSRTGSGTHPSGGRSCWNLKQKIWRKYS